MTIGVLAMADTVAEGFGTDARLPLMGMLAVGFP